MEDPPEERQEESPVNPKENSVIILLFTILTYSKGSNITKS